MTTYRLRVWYAADRDEDTPQTEGGLTAEQVTTAAAAFVRDLALLGGAGVRRLTVEIES